MTKYFVFILAFITFKLFACSNNSEMSVWLGNNSEFSKIYTKSKCALEKELEGISPAKKKLIAKMIANSFQKEPSNNNLSF